MFSDTQFEMTKSQPGPQLVGVLLAAGRGRRMNGAKQFHPVETSAGRKPLVAAAYDAIAPFCDSMIVVLGHRAEEVAEVLEPREFTAVLSDPDAPMFDSVRVGLLAAQRVHPQATVMLQPADHAQIEPATIEQLLAAFATAPDSAIMPTFEGRGGHPALVPAGIVDKILRTACPDGLNQFWRNHSDSCLRIPVSDAGVVQDIDTIT